MLPGNAAAFFRDNFDWVRVGDGKAFATGYYIPETAGSRTPAPGYAVPIYRTPPDLVRCTRPDGTTGRSRIDETGACVPYYSRAEIEDGALANKGLESLGLLIQSSCSLSRSRVPASFGCPTAM